MSHYDLTKARILQWIGIVLVLGVFAGAYWYFQVFAGYKTNSSQTGTLTSGLVGMWSFDGADISGTTAYDRSGSGNNGTLTNGPAVVQGKVGQALEFDGSNDRVAIASSGAALNLTTTLSWSAWIYPQTFGGNGLGRIIDKNTGNSGVFFVDNSNITSGLGFAGNGGAILASSKNNAIATNTWQHVVVTFSSGTVSFYVNGVLNNSTATAMTLASDTTAFAIGERSSGAGDRGFDGFIDEVRVYNRVLSAGEIQAQYAAGQSDEVNSGASQVQGGTRLDSGLAGYWKMDDGSGTNATDSSTNGNTGTLTNGPTWGTGQIGGAVSFDATNDEINLGDVVEPEYITLSAWINRTGNGFASVISKGSILTSEQYSLFVDAAAYGTVEFVVRAVGGGFDHCRTSSAGYTTGQWYHVTGTYNGATCRVYVNGIDKTETVVSDTTSGAINSGSSSLLIAPAFNGLVDEARIYNRALLADEVAELYRLTTPTAVDTSLKGYWSFNGKDLGGTSAYDRSGAGNTGTLTNGPTVTPGKLGQALSLNGSSQYITLGSTPVTAVPVTLTAWIKPAVTNAGVAVAILHTGNNGWNGFYIGFGSGQVSCSSASNSAFGSAAMNGTVGEWQFVSCTMSSITNRTVFVNGVAGTTDTTSINPASTPNNLVIGAANHDNSFDNNFNGLIDEVRVYNRVLSAGEIQAQYAAGQSDEVNSGSSQAQGGTRLDSGLAGYWKMDDGSGTSATDASTNENTGTLTNGPTWGTGQIGGDVVFDGVNDYINIPFPPTSIKPQARMSISAWVKRSASGEVDYIFWERDSVAQEEGIFFYFDTDNKMHFVFRISGTGYVDVASTTTVTDTNWHMLTATLGASNLLTFYVDGTYAGSGTTTTPNTGVTIGNALIGARNDGTTPDAYGSFSIDEFRFYSRTLSADEVSQLYRLTTPTGTDTSLKGYWSFNGKDISGTTAFDRSGAGNTGSLYNGPTVTPGKVGQALDFDAVNDHIETTDSSAVDFGDTDDFTLSGWFNRDTFTDTNALVGKRSGFAVGDAGYIAYIDATTDQLIFQLSDGTDVYTITSASTFTATGWHHFTVVWDQDSAANSEIYIDGVDDNATDTGTIGNIGDLSNAFGLYIAARSDGGALFDGKIDEVRIYNRALTMGEITGLYNAGR